MCDQQQACRGADHAVYQCRLPLSNTTITMVADLLRGHLKQIGSRWRKLLPGKVAVIVLAHLRHDQRLADLAGGNGVSPSTIRRWVLEAIALLARRAPRLQRALNTISAAGGDVVLLDGTLVRTRRRSGTENRRNYSGKHKVHGLLFLALTDEAPPQRPACHPAAARPAGADQRRGHPLTDDFLPARAETSGSGHPAVPAKWDKAGTAWAGPAR